MKPRRTVIPITLDRRRFVQGVAASLWAAAAMPRPAQALDTQFGNTKSLFSVNIETITFGLESFEERIRQVAALGFDAVEFWDYANKDIDALADVCEEMGMIISQFVLRGFVNHPTLHENFRQNLEAAIPVAHRLGVSRLTVIPGTQRDDASPEEQLEACIEGYRAVTAICEEADITLMVKPLNRLIDHPTVLVSKSQEAAEIVRQVDHRYVRMVFDTYHQQVTEGNLLRNIESYYRAAPLIEYFQIADNPGHHEPGTGEINFRNVLQAIYEYGYRGYIGLEMLPRRTAQQALAAVVNADQW